MALYLSSAPKLGDVVCIDITLQNVNSSYVTGSENIVIKNSAGVVFLNIGCVSSGGTITGPNAYKGGNECLLTWDTSAPYDGNAPAAGSYTMTVTSGPLASNNDILTIEASLTLSSD